MELLSGKQVSEQRKKVIKETIERCRPLAGRPPCLVAVIVGSNGASETYVASKEKNSHEVGMSSHILRLPMEISQAALMDEIQKLNEDDQVDGFIIQLPLPSHLDEKAITFAIDPAKDVDGFHPYNTGLMLKGLPTFLPATPYGVMLMLEYYQIPTAGKHAVVIGRSDIVGKPMAALLSRNTNPGNCTVTMCHSRTANLDFHTLQADILVVASGIPEMIHGHQVKEGAVVIDVGITRVSDPNHPKGFVIKGDVHFESVAPKSSFITPVPGGVGLMTITGLLQNTLLAWSRRFQLGLD